MLFLSVRHYWTGGFDVLHEQSACGTQSAEAGENEKDVDVGEKAGLANKDFPYFAQRLLVTIDGAALMGEHRAHPEEPGLIRGVIRREVPGQKSLMHLRASIGERGDDGDPYASPNVSHKIENATGITDLVGPQRTQRQAVERYKKEGN